MRKNIFSGFVLILSVLAVAYLLFSGCGIVSRESKDLTGLKFVSSFEDGNLYQTNTTSGSSHFYVLQLKGSFKEMGRQYGYLAKTQLSDLYSETMSMLNDKGIPYSTIESIANEYYDVRTIQMKDLMFGMSETSGLSLEAVKIVASMPIYMLFSCSAFSAWGDYTTDGGLYFGRNWDLNKGIFANMGKYLTVVVYNPTGASQSVADINFCGSIFPQTCINSKGIMLELNNGSMSSSAVNPSGEESIFLFISWLLNSSTLDGLVSNIESITHNGAAILNMCDSSKAYSFEITTTASKLRAASQEGFISVSNDFADPRWTGLPYIGTGEAYGFTRERRNNLYNLGAINKGNIDASKMKEILDTTIPDGGATFPDADPQFETYIQVVFAPATKQMWLKFRGYSGWEFIDLSQLFTNR